MDIDTAHPMYTPTLTGKTANFLGQNQNANDKTMTNPLEWFYCKSDAPKNQTYTTANNDYIRVEDKTITTVIAGRSAEEIAVNNAVAAGAVATADKAYWLCPAWQGDRTSCKS